MSVKKWFLRGAAVTVVAGVVAGVAAGVVAAAPPAAAARPAAPVIAAGGGGHGADFTGDGRPDLLAREKGTGVLTVYPHSGTFDGENTYPTAVPIGSGWGEMRWIGALDLNLDGLAEVLAIDQDWQLVAAVHSGTFDGENTLLPGLVVVGEHWDANNLVTVTTGGLFARSVADGKIYRYQHSGKLDGTNTFQPPKEPNTTRLDQHDTDRYVNAGGLGSDNGGFLFITEGGELYARSTESPSQRVSLGGNWHLRDSYVLTDVNGDHYEDIVTRIPTDGRLLVYVHSGADPFQNPSVYGQSVILGTGWQNYDIIT